LLGEEHAMQDIRQLALGELRARVGMVTQNVELFDGTVRDNLTFWDPTVSTARIETVLRELGLGDWLDALPQGLESPVSAGGASLSAGQAQLLAMARVFLQDPGLVVLDEASSRLDPATEELVQQATDRLMAGRSGIIIAHRLATIQSVDEILILDEGRVVEQGQRAALAADPTSRLSALLCVGLEEVLA
jgi:ATP-binding cassette, subfamily B, bacterial